MDKAPKPISAIAPFGLRMQPALKAEIERLAKENARSVNAQIVHMLEDNLRDLRLEKAAEHQAHAQAVAIAHGRRVQEALEAPPSTKEQKHHVNQPQSVDLEAMLERAARKGAEQAVSELMSEDIKTQLLSPLNAIVKNLTADEMWELLQRRAEMYPGEWFQSPGMPDQKPATPSIPGVNAPKRGLGAAPKSEKPKRERVQTTKKRVFVKTDNTKYDHS